MARGCFPGSHRRTHLPLLRDKKSTYNQHWAVQRKGTLISQKLKDSKDATGLRVWFSKEGLSVPMKEGDWYFAESEGAWAAVRVVSGGTEFLPEAPASKKKAEPAELEGGKRIAVENGKLVIESQIEEDLNEAESNHLVCWLTKEMPGGFLLEFKVRPQNRKQGLNIVFFNVRGVHGESIFDPALKPRTGRFSQYHSGDLNNYHISYWAAERGTVNVRKNAGFQHVATGSDLVSPAPEDALLLC